MARKYYIEFDNEPFRAGKYKIYKRASKAKGKENISHFFWRYTDPNKKCNQTSKPIDHCYYWIEGAKANSKEEYHNKQVYEELKVLYERKNKLGDKVDLDILFLRFAENEIERKKNMGIKSVGVDNLAVKDFIQFLTEKKGINVNLYKVADIDKQTLEEFAKYLEGKYKGRTGWLRMMQIKAMVNNAKDKGILNISTKGIRVAIGQTMKKETLKKDEITKLLNTRLPKPNKEYDRIIEFVLFTGVRSCEVRMLRCGDVDFRNNKIYIRQSKIEGKTDNSTREIPITDKIKHIVDCCKDRDINELVFKYPSQQCLMNRYLKKWCKVADVPVLSMHCLRHTFATLLANNGETIQKVSKIIGHKNIATTMRYYHNNTEKDKDILDNAFGFLDE